MKQRIGYARVSTDDQNLDLQRDALTKSACKNIYEEKASGKSADRPQLENCLKALRADDTLVDHRGADSIFLSSGVSTGPKRAKRFCF